MGLHPDLALSLNNLSNRLSDLGRREEELAASEEAVELLLPYFERFPAALAQNMGIMANNLLERLLEAGREPGEHALLQRLVVVFERLQGGE